VITFLYLILIVYEFSSSRELKLFGVAIKSFLFFYNLDRDEITKLKNCLDKNTDSGTTYLTNLDKNEMLRYL